MTAGSSADRRRKESRLNRHFHGFYFKQSAKDHAIALVAAIGQDAQGHSFASIQVVLPDETFSVPFAPESAHFSPSGPDIRFGENRLNASGFSVNLEGSGHSVRGALRFGPLARPDHDIMGPFRLFPFMECRHHLISMAHEVIGRLIVDGTEWNFNGALGYIEGDSGRSFPTRYLWTHCFPPPGGPRSVMLSVAEIPYLGCRFSGVVGFILLDGRVLRLATYLGAKAQDIREGRVVVRQGGYTLTASFERSGATLLDAPVNGGMARSIGESLSGHARYQLEHIGHVIFDFISENASFEYEYDR